MHANYSFLFEKEGMLLVIDIKIFLHMHVIICAMSRNFGTKCFKRGERKTQEKSNFSEKW